MHFLFPGMRLVLHTSPLALKFSPPYVNWGIAKQVVLEF